MNGEKSGFLGPTLGFLSLHAVRELVEDLRNPEEEDARLYDLIQTSDISPYIVVVVSSVLASLILPLYHRS